jgi:hypothetical protein
VLGVGPLWWRDSVNKLNAPVGHFVWPGLLGNYYLVYPGFDRVNNEWDLRGGGLDHLLLTTASYQAYKNRGNAVTNKLLIQEECPTI